MRAVYLILCGLLICAAIVAGIFCYLTALTYFRVARAPQPVAIEGIVFRKQMSPWRVKVARAYRIRCDLMVSEKDSDGTALKTYIPVTSFNKADRRDIGLIAMFAGPVDCERLGDTISGIVEYHFADAYNPFHLAGGSTAVPANVFLCAHCSPSDYLWEPLAGAGLLLLFLAGGIFAAFKSEQWRKRRQRLAAEVD